MQEKKQIIQFSKIFKVISTIIMWIMIISSAIHFLIFVEEHNTPIKQLVRK